jgi:cytochrome oxidase assembly protein ShyY1
MTHARGRLRSGLAVPVIFVLAAAATFIALGTWQLQRKAWKEALIATLEQRLSAPPVPLPPPENWARLNPADDEFRRVSFSATLIPEPPALVYTAGSSLRAVEAGPGYWVFAPARLTSGAVVVINRGFIPESRNDPQTLALGDRAGNIERTGILRWPEPRGYFAPKAQPERNLWFVRDHLAIAAGKDWENRWGEMAPFYIELESPEPAGGLPHPVVLTPSLRNAHLQYAITWYVLSGTVIVMFAIWMKDRGK